MVAGPERAFAAPAGGEEVADEVAVGIKDADLGDVPDREVLLAAGLAQQVFRAEDGGCVVALVGEQRGRLAWAAVHAGGSLGWLG